MKLMAMNDSLFLFSFRLIGPGVLYLLNTLCRLKMKVASLESADKARGVNTLESASHAVSSSHKDEETCSQGVIILFSSYSVQVNI